MSDELETLVKQLAMARSRAEEARNTLREVTEKLHQSPEYIEATSEACEATANETALDIEIRNYALNLYSHDENKHPHPKIEIKLVAGVSMLDENGAREWCFANFRPALKLDASTFNKAVRDGNIPTNLAVVYKKPTTYISADLG